MNKLHEILRVHEKNIRVKYSSPDTVGMPFIFLGYRYLKTSNNVYVKKKYQSEHEYALTYREWSNIIQIYFKYLWQFLLTGRKYELRNIGVLRLCKYEATPIIDWVKTLDKGVVTRVSDLRLNRKYFYLNWNKYKKKVKWINYWKVRVGRPYYVPQIKHYRKNPHEYSKLPTLGKYAKNR